MRGSTKSFAPRVGSKVECTAERAWIGEVRRGFQPIGAMGVDENVERDLQGLREPSVRVTGSRVHGHLSRGKIIFGHVYAFGLEQGHVALN